MPALWTPMFRLVLWRWANNMLFGVPIARRALFATGSTAHASVPFNTGLGADDGASSHSAKQVPSRFWCCQRSALGPQGPLVLEGGGV